jgi:hypothetical protein
VIDRFAPLRAPGEGVRPCSRSYERALPASPPSLNLNERDGQEDGHEEEGTVPPSKPGMSFDKANHNEYGHDPEP